MPSFRAVRSGTAPRSSRRVTVSLAFALGGASIFASVLPASGAEAPVGLGTATSFAVLAGSGITNTGPTTIKGDVGSHPTPTITGFEGNVTQTGTNYGGGPETQQAKEDLLTAYNDAAGRSSTPVAEVELGGKTLLPGVYSQIKFGLTGTLTLDAQNNPDAVFIFQTSETLITEANSKVSFINGGNPCNVVWKVGSSATFKTDTAFVGDVLAHTSITAQTRATFVTGRLLALNGAVTLDTNTIDRGACAQVAPATTTTTSTTSTTVTGDTTSGGTATTSTTTAGSGDGTTAGATAGSADGTTAGGTGTTSGGGTTGGSATTSGSATTGGRTTGGSGTTGGGSPRVPLASTGASDDALLLAGFALVAFGTITLVATRPHRRRFSHSR